MHDEKKVLLVLMAVVTSFGLAALAGRNQRLNLLRTEFPEIQRHLANRPSGVGRDDLLGAAAAAWTAHRQHDVKQSAFARQSEMKRVWRRRFTIDLLNMIFRQQWSGECPIHGSNEAPNRDHHVPESAQPF